MIKIKTENLKEKINKKRKLELKYNRELAILKQFYGLEFELTHFENHSISTINFVNLRCGDNIKNVTLLYDNKYDCFNFLYYEYDSETSIHRTNDRAIVNRLKKEYKLKIIVKEIKKMNQEYCENLNEIDKEYVEKREINEKILEIKKNSEN